jgi:3-hydroxyacyl-CoA dehydrogenase
MTDKNTVVVIGAGAMGHGLAIQFALEDKNPVLLDHKQQNIEKARSKIRNTVSFLRNEDVTNSRPDEVIESIDFTTDLKVGLSCSDIVLETISEDLSAKRALFSDIVRIGSDEAVLASNTSSFRISAIAEAVPEHQERLIGCHWLFPPYLMKPVEIILGKQTSERTQDRMFDFVTDVNRDPVIVNRDVPGFVWNRIQFAVIRECLHIVEEGIASIEDVSTAIRSGYATRMAAIGPFETMDIAGLDLFADLADEIYPDLAIDQESQRLLREKVDQGKTGVDAGEGFFSYNDSRKSVTNKRDRRVLSIMRALHESDEAR